MAKVVLLTNGQINPEVTGKSGDTILATNIATLEAQGLKQTDLERDHFRPRVVEKLQKGNGDLLYWEPTPEAESGSKVKWYTKDGIYP